MDSMTGIPVVQYTFKRSDQVTTIQSKSSEDVDGQSIHVDPELLFQSLIAIDDRKALFRSSCVATHRLSLSRHSCREHHRKPFW